MFANNSRKIVTILSVFLALSVFVPNLDAYARAGFGRSVGSRSYHSFTSNNHSSYLPYSQPRPIYPNPDRPINSQWSSSSGRHSFSRGLAGGVMGGFLGSMLFGGFRHGMGWGGGFGGGGIGLFDLVLIGGLIFMVVRFIKRKSQWYNDGSNEAYREPMSAPGVSNWMPAQSFTEVRQLDPGIDEGRFKDQCMDDFFKIQAAWMNRNMADVRSILTDEMLQIMDTDVSNLKREGKINKLENIAVRSVDITDVRHDNGLDFITVRFTANLLDYTVSDQTGEVQSGSKTDPIKFVEYWTFVRAFCGGTWQLSAINQDA